MTGTYNLTNDQWLAIRAFLGDGIDNHVSWLEEADLDEVDDMPGEMKLVEEANAAYTAIDAVLGQEQTENALA